MDDIVKQAMAKWPNVPAVYGWLALDRRGNWLLKRERIPNPVITAFINRNYQHDEQGRWFFQNGPQRVYVALDYTPFVYRLPSSAIDAAPTLETHTGLTVARVEGAWIDESGVVLVATEYGPGMVEDRGLERLLPCFTQRDCSQLTDDEIDSRIDRVQQGFDADVHFCYAGKTVQVAPIKARRVPLKFGFVPLPAAGSEECI